MAAILLLAGSLLNPCYINCAPVKAPIASPTSNAPFAIGYVTLFFLLKGKVPSGPGKVEELASLSLLFSLQKTCPYSLNVYALGRDKVVSEYMRFRFTLLIILLLLSLIIFDI